MYVLLQGEDTGYLGRWTVEDGCSATKIESDWLTERSMNTKSFDVWSAGDGTGLYFLYRDWDSVSMVYGDYQAVWLDDAYQEKEGLPDITEGHVYQITTNPFSGKVYLCGMDADELIIDDNSLRMTTSGFTIWEEGKKAPVFTTLDEWMYPFLAYVSFISEDRHMMT